LPVVLCEPDLSCAFSGQSAVSTVLNGTMIAY